MIKNQTNQLEDLYQGKKGWRDWEDSSNPSKRRKTNRGTKRPECWKRNDDEEVAEDEGRWFLATPSVEVNVALKHKAAPIYRGDWQAPAESEIAETESWGFRQTGSL